jgi:hypothetical protein
VKISKTEYAVFVYYKLESKYKKSNKFEEVMVQNQKKIMSDFIWIESTLLWYEQFVCTLTIFLKTNYKTHKYVKNQHLRHCIFDLEVDAMYEKIFFVA